MIRINENKIKIFVERLLFVFIDIRAREILSDGWEGAKII